MSANNRGSFPPKLQLLIISNNYEGLSWDGSASDAANNMELQSTSQDVERLIRWSTYLNSHYKCVIKNAAKQDIVYALQQAGDTPRVIYFNGHTSAVENSLSHSFTYWPRDCLTGDDVTPSNGLTSTEILDILACSQVKNTPILVVTDVNAASS
ncbi:hypothetical protein FRC12_024999 [Ceratobasidium sp. 428]|nr:hypothetical protein FRC12_024999 [Ceratobasidium sp. 428]